MPFVSLTRLRLRSVRFLPAFAVHAMRSRRQAARAPGFLGGALLADRAWTFWTMTAWDGAEDMRRYMATGPHRAAMPRLAGWCDEASVAHWDQADAILPTWTEADARMRGTGRPSRVRAPSPRHAGLDYHPPRTRTGGAIRPARPG